jgi:hypothetical protein
MFTFDAVFYKRNSVLDESPFFLVPGKWMARAFNEDYSFDPPTDEEAVSPRIMHSCKHGKFYTGANHGHFLEEDLPHNYKCKDCLMRPSDKMLTLYTLLK